MIDAGKTDRQIWDEMLKARGPLMTQAAPETVNRNGFQPEGLGVLSPGQGAKRRRPGYAPRTIAA